MLPTAEGTTGYSKPQCPTSSWDASTPQSPPFLDPKCNTEDHLEIPTYQKQEMLDQINTTVAAVLKSMVGGSPSTVYWKPKGCKKGIAYFVDANVTSSQYRFCCVSEITASVQDVMKLFIMTDTATLLKNYRVVYNNVLDACVLNVVSHPTTTNPFKSVYVRYSCFATPKLMADRDMCVVAATDVFSHVDDSTIGYCLWDSVDVPATPDYRNAGVLRSRMFKSGFVLRSSPDTPDVTKIVYLVGLAAGGRAPRLVTKLVVDRFGANLARIVDHFRRRHLDPKTFVHRAHWGSKSDAQTCRGCHKKFYALSSRTNCVACGCVVCKQCYTQEKVDVPGAGLTTVAICTSCLEARGVNGSLTQQSESNY